MNIFSMYAIINVGGSQHKVHEGYEFTTNLDPQLNPDVLCLFDGKNLHVGRPTVPSASVSLQIIDHVRGPKGVAFKKKRRKGYQKTIGFHAKLVRVKVEHIKH